jgi:regulator of sigma E protease
MSLGFMNLLPIPPLDGGKILIELIQAAIRRPLSMKAQTAISYVGLAFFAFVFIVVVRNDVMRFIVG